MQRTNPFINIYRSCNNGTNEEKAGKIDSGEIQLPRYIDIELTNHCNFRCCFCPTGTKSMMRMRGFMPEQVVDSIIYNISKYHIPGVRFSRWGEPTMHPDYINIIKRVHDAGALTHINTNGSRLDESQIKQLLAIPLDSIKFSFQGADEGTYNEMREGGDYEKLLQTIKLMHNLRKSSPPIHSNFNNSHRRNRIAN